MLVHVVQVNQQQNLNLFLRYDWIYNLNFDHAYQVWIQDFSKGDSDEKTRFQTFLAIFGNFPYDFFYIFPKKVVSTPWILYYGD